jgi:hypothetical protein
MSAKKTTGYENNPFNVGLSGLSLLFEKAQSIAIFAIVLMAFGFAANIIDISTNLTAGSFTPRPHINGEKTRNWEHFTHQLQSIDPAVLITAGVVLATIIFVMILISLLIAGILEYSAAELSKGRAVTFKQALAAVWHRLAGYLWLHVVLIVKVFLWSLLLIVPGIIMAIRYSLAGVAFFAEDIGGNQAVRRSAALTKGGVITTFSSMTLWNILTLGMAKSLLDPSVKAVLYGQFTEVEKSGKNKPPAHWLSWLTLVLPIAFAALLVISVVLLVGFYSVTAGVKP